MSYFSTAPMDLAAPIGDVSPLDMSEADYRLWLAQCRRGIGGSSAGALLGVSPYDDWRDIYDRILGLERPKEMTDPLRRGIIFEPTAIEEYARITDRSPYRVGYVQDPERPYLVGNPDAGLREDNRPEWAEGEGILEVKAPGKEMHRNIRENGVPDMYYAQLQHYLGITRREWGAFQIFHPDTVNSYTIDVPRDESTIELLRERALDFWHAHIVPRIRPERTLSTEVPPPPVVILPNVGTEATIVSDGASLTAIETYLEARRMRKLAERTEALAKEELQEVFERYETDLITTPDRGVRVSWRESSRRNFNYKALLDDYPGLDPTPYESTTYFRRMQAHEKK